MNTIFTKDQFELCDAPVPKGYPQSQTHCGVACVGNLLLMTSSPFPTITNSKLVRYIKAGVRKLTKGRIFKLVPGDYYENPCIYISSNETTFRLLQSHPLMECPDAYPAISAFNSDPDIYVENNFIYITNRAVYRFRGHDKIEYGIRLYLIKGLYDKNYYKYLGTELVAESDKPFGSQCTLKYNDKYIFSYIDSGSYNDGQTFSGIYVNKSDKFGRDLFNYNTAQKIHVETDLLPWHFSLFTYKEKLYSVIACVEPGKDHFCWQMLGEFDNELSKLHIYKTPLTDYNSYRSSAYVTSDGIFHLYNTTVCEKIKGSKSVDGRDIILASMNFEELMCRLKEND